VALLNVDDWLHERAVESFEAIGSRRGVVVTTNLVLAELANSLARTGARSQATSFIREILREPRARVIHVEASLFLMGLKRYEDCTDKGWGLVDCVSFELMRQEGIQNAFTSDHHFEQAGFHCLLRHAQRSAS